MTEKLFSGAIGTPDGPTIHELYASCAKDFGRVGNPWRMIASKIRQRGLADPSSWKFQELDISMRVHQLTCFNAVIGLTKTRNDPKTTQMCDAVAACMLSKMLTESPQYVPG